MKTFKRIGLIDFEVIDDNSDFVPDKAIDIADCMAKNLVPPEVGNLEYDSDENGENVSFDDASPIIPDKIAALERLSQLEAQYKAAKDNKAAADAAAVEAQKMAAAADTVTSVNQPSEAQA